MFSAPMVLAILAGRKSQTRRLVKLPPWLAKRNPSLGAAWPDPGLGDGGYLKVPHSGEANLSEWMWPIERVRCPHGDIGDRLWVRETHGTTTGNGIRTVYRADGEPRDLLTGRLITGMKWTPSIFMRRHQSRITLEVTGVRVERLQAISEADARAEGCDAEWCGQDLGAGDGYTSPRSHVAAYARLWDRINGKRAPWDSNPWVWVVEFRNAEEVTRGR